LSGRDCISGVGIWAPEIIRMRKFLLLIFILIFNSCIVDDWDLIFNGKLQNIFLFDGCINYSVSSSVLSNDGNVLICGNFNEKISIIKPLLKVIFSGEKITPLEVTVLQNQSYKHPPMTFSFVVRQFKTGPIKERIYFCKN
jgi:hypothetical protein